MPPSKWTCPRERTPATANTSYAVPQRRSRRRLAGSPKPSMESRQAHSIHGVALSKASSRPRCATRGIPAPRCRARPAHNAAQSHQQRRRAQATPAHGTSMRPIRVPKKTEIRPKLQLFCDCELPRGVKTRIDARKSGKSDAQRPISASRRTERSPPIAKKLHRSRNFCFCETDRRNGAILAKDTCAFNANQAEQQHGTTAHRPYKHSCPHPWQRSRASSTEKCNI